MGNKILIYTDGGARGNPGPAAVGAVVKGLSQGKLTFSEYLGSTTNNEAEYRALVLALLKVKEFKNEIKSIECFADSELMVKQLNGEYRVKDTNLRLFFNEVTTLVNEIGVPVTFSYIPRAKNAEADKLVNQTLDLQAGI